MNLNSSDSQVATNLQSAPEPAYPRRPLSWDLGLQGISHPTPKRHYHPCPGSLTCCSLQQPGTEFSLLPNDSSPKPAHILANPSGVQGIFLLCFFKPEFTVTVRLWHLGLLLFFCFFCAVLLSVSPPPPFPHLLLSSCGRGSSVVSSREAHLQIILLLFPCYITPVSSPLRCQIVPPVTVTISSACNNCVSLDYYSNLYSTFQGSCRVFPPATPASYYLSSTCAAPGRLCLHACTLTTASNLCIWVQAENPDLTLKALKISTWCSHHVYIMKMNWRLFRLLWSLWLYTHIISEV